MEYRSILVATVTIYCGLYYLTKDLEDTSKIILFVVIVVINAYFLIYWIRKMMGAGISFASTKIPCLKRLFRIKELADGMDDKLNVSPEF
jgi:hypothetical protein